jgi:hypothetical protein
MRRNHKNKGKKHIKIKKNTEILSLPSKEGKCMTFHIYPLLF